MSDRYGTSSHFDGGAGLRSRYLIEKLPMVISLVYDSGYGHIADGPIVWQSLESSDAP